MILLDILPEKALDILWELKVAGVFIFVLLTTIPVLFSILIRRLHKDMAVLQKTIEEKDAKIEALHEKNDSYLREVVNLTATLIDTNQEMVNSLNQSSENLSNLAKSIDASNQKLENIKRSLKTKT